ncbi:hypothetical protein TSA6c_00075 [Azospirillum sp. TSA6c]|uniref:DUF6378 domain-containing protein n=1 Tax=Azospirillum sp. TSA6c TaxID=709813 RepID=UPI000D61A635|nr:DUF6378 domain-containing protein [Azospirillum sp. TSA6c]PWC54677.1 hypothetical protein TSA6c_00075 [Azospirillum sp. TSA6c]
MTIRADILQEASDLIHGDRLKTYGDPATNFSRIAVGWSAIFGQRIEPHQVCLAMAWLKIARLTQDATARDGTVDGAAYLALAGELAAKS